MHTCQYLKQQEPAVSLLLEHLIPAKVNLHFAGTANNTDTSHKLNSHAVPIHIPSPRMSIALHCHQKTRTCSVHSFQESIVTLCQ